MSTMLSLVMVGQERAEAFFLSITFFFSVFPPLVPEDGRHDCSIVDLNVNISHILFSLAESINSVITRLVNTPGGGTA